MSDINDSDVPAVESADPSVEQELKNFKAESHRKLENMNAQLEAILASVQQSTASRNQPPQVEQRPLRDLILDDPDAAVAQIEERVSRRADQMVEQRLNNSQAVQSEITNMQARYPEFGQDGSEAIKLATAKLSQLPAGLKGRPEGLKMAMLEAVAELGLIPASKRSRTSAGEDFSLSANSSSRPSSKAAAKTEIPELTRAWFELLNPDAVNDAKRKESLKAAVERKNYRRKE